MEKEELRTRRLRVRSNRSCSAGVSALMLIDVDQVSQLYAQHPVLIQTVGAMAMSMAMSHLARGRGGN